jgi:hypothetical protein
VKIRSKLVALFLLLGLLASPAVAMAGCWGNAASGTAKPCEPHCPKMAAMMEKMSETSSSSIRAGSAMSTCCSVSPSRPEPAAQLTGPQSSSSMIAPAVRVSVNLTARPVVIEANAAPPPILAPSQTLLCTFLI